MFAYCSNCDFEYIYGQRGGIQLCVVSLDVAQNGPEMKITKTSVHVDSSTQNICITIVSQGQNIDTKYKSESREG